jgi:hypothetical protein
MRAEAGHYYFHHGVNCLFEMATSDARRILPAHLQPLEVQHTRSVLAVTCFTFHGGDAGPYEEIVLGILVPPVVKPGGRLPKAAMYPLIVGCSTADGRNQGIDRWKLPHLMEDIQGEFIESNEGKELLVKMSAGGAPIMEMTVTAHEFEESELLFHTFVSDDSGNYKSDLIMRGKGYSEHEFEKGSLTLYEHELTQALTLDEVEEVPFREQWMKDGVEIFHELENV